MVEKVCQQIGLQGKRKILHKKVDDQCKRTITNQCYGQRWKNKVYASLLIIDLVEISNY